MFGMRVNKEVLIVLSSLLVQVPLAVFLGHYYDERVFMASGYLVGSGLNPYQPHDFTGIFNNPLFAGVIPSIGYPPPWPLLLGVIFRFSYALFQNVFFYNFAIKIPVIVGNICLAYIVKRLVVKYYADEKKARLAFLFVLLNPFTLLTTVAWGEFDTVVALFCIASLYFLSEERVKASALSLAIGLAMKPIALPLAGIPLLFSTPHARRRNIQYLLVFSVIFLGLYFLPFFLLGWNIPLAPDQRISQFTTAGGLSLFNINEFFRSSETLPSSLQFLGFLWVPSVILGYYFVYRNRPCCFNELVEKVIAVMLIFFLTRSWVSEPNINLILPLMFLVVNFDKPNFRNFHFLWIIPLIFMFLNYSFPQLFFLIYPQIMGAMTTLDQHILSLRLLGRFLIVIPWQILGWRLVVKMLHPKK